MASRSHNHMSDLMPLYFEWLRVHNYSEMTVINRNKYLKAFIAWTKDRGIEQAVDVTRPVLERYQRYLHLYRQRNGNPIAVRTQICHIAAIRAFFKWLCRERYVASNPASELILPRKEFRLPANVMTPPQIERVLAVPDVHEYAGLRDRAIMETFYSCGIRRQEMIRLTPQDLDRDRGVVLVRQGKGKKDRIVPIGARALLWIDKYMQEVRVGHQPDDPLFLSDKGKPLKLNFLSQMVGRYVAASGVRKFGACHLFRHAMATAMLDNGADVRIVQEMLGHANLQTTAIYTHVAVAKLKQIHEATHPAKMPPVDVDRNQETA